MLDESDGLPQHRPAHPVTPLQRLLGPQRLPDRPATPDDVGLDATRNLGSPLIGPALGGRTGFRTHTSVTAQLRARPQ
jgi:hypothetical protein